MAKRQPKTLQITKQPSQISAPGGELTNYLLKNIPIWGNPQWMDASIWRSFVRQQPLAVLCREALAEYLISLDWAIVSRDATEQDERKEDIKYYTRLFERGNAYYSDLDFTSHIEWFAKDLFDLPFGTASELGREYDDPEGKVVWIKPLDGGTLNPTLNKDYPVVQHYPSYQPVAFPKEFISRVYLSPRTEIIREGWGMPPPERIYLAMEMLNRGDFYYSQLMLNTPEAGILDLGDTEKDIAIEFIQSFKDGNYGINPLKIPVLYEHTSDVKWIPFGKLPNDIMFDKVTMRYAAIVSAGYGLTLSDIGFPSSSNGGETLAGTIRQERKSAKSGKSLIKKKFQRYAENILPDSLQWQWKDFDDEKNVAMGRARMASASAFKTFIDGQVVSPDEARRQIIADGIMTITIPEVLDRKSIEWPNNTLTYQGVKNSLNATGKEGTSKVGSPKAPSGGGQGDTIPQQVISRSRAKIEVSLSKAVYSGNQLLGALLNSVKTGNNDFQAWEKKFDDAVIGKSQMDLVSEAVIDDTYNAIAEILEKSEWLDTVSKELSHLANQSHFEIQKNRKEEALLKNAEEEFINGVREDIILTPEELESIHKSHIEKDLTSQIGVQILEKLIPVTISVAKSCVLGYKFDLDTTQFQDHNTIKVAKETATKVYQLLPKIVEDIYLETIKSLGE